MTRANVWLPQTVGYSNKDK